MSYVSEVTADSPSAWFRLGEMSGTSAADEIGGAAGTYTGGVTLGQTSLVSTDTDTSVLFDGSTGYVTAADRAAFALGDRFTIECWIKPTAYIDSSGVPGCMIDLGSGGPIVRFADAQDGTFILRRNGVSTLVTSTAIIPLNVVAHIVVAHSSAGTFLWLNGVDVTGSVTPDTFIDATLPLNIGAADGGDNDFFAGQIDEVALYGDTVLSAARVLAHYQAATEAQAMRVLDEPLTHACQLDLRDGRHMRWGPDERDVGNVPISLQFQTTLPGGYGPGQIVLPRPAWFEAEDARLLAAGRMYIAETDQTIYEGRLTGTPQVGPSQIEIDFEGWSKHLEDDETARFLGIDRDMSHWTSPSVQRKINVSATSFTLTDATIQPDATTGIPAVLCEVSGAWATKKPLTEGWYNARGLDIGLVDYAWKLGATIITTDGSWVFRLGASSDDVDSDDLNTGSLLAAGPGSGTLTLSGGKKFAYVALYYDSTPAGADGESWPLYWTLLTPIGDHGLPLQGSVAAPNTGRGLLLSDIATYLLDRFAPLLTYSTGALGSIPPTTFAIPHVAYLDWTTAAAMLADLVPYGGTTDLPLDWGVYDRREFFLRSPGSYGTDWHTRRDLGTQPTSQGADSAAAINGVLVTYDDGAGTTRSVGPPGSGADLEDARLLDTSPSNPANEDGARHWTVKDAGITSQDGALIIGQLMLAAARRSEWRGDIAIKHVIHDHAGHEHPAALVKSGDRVAIDDDADTSPRRIVNTTYTSEDRTCTASAGAPPDLLDVVLARAAIAATTVTGAAS